ncbi:MAG: hypothetical protein J6B23_07225, partial [Clostridia bacterium]|nr:hypothetical protein [Clostridia bacterium]
PSGFLQPSASVTNNFISIQVQRIFGVGFLRQWEAKYPIILTYLRIFYRSSGVKIHTQNGFGY